MTPHVHLANGPRLDHTWCDRPSPKHTTTNPDKVTSPYCRLAFDEPDNKED